MKKLFKKVTFKNVKGKVFVAVAGLGMLAVPNVSMAAGTAPSTYINKGTNSLVQEGMKIAPGIGILVAIIALIFYLCAQNDHEKSKQLKLIGKALFVVALIAVTPAVFPWFTGLFK